MTREDSGLKKRKMFTGTSLLITCLMTRTLDFLSGSLAARLTCPITVSIDILKKVVEICPVSSRSARTLVLRKHIAINKFSMKLVDLQRYLRKSLAFKREIELSFTCQW